MKYQSQQANQYGREEITPAVRANSLDAVSCASRRRSRRVPAFPRRLWRAENHHLNDGGRVGRISNTTPGGHIPLVIAVPSPRRNAHQVQGRFRNNNGRHWQIPRLPRDAAGISQTRDFACPRQRFLQRHTFDLARFNFRNATISFRLPRGSDGCIHAAVPRDHDAVNQFGDHLNRHLAGLFDNLIQRHRHDASLTQPIDFDKGEAEAEEKRSETVIQKIFDELPLP